MHTQTVALFVTQRSIFILFVDRLLGELEAGMAGPRRVTYACHVPPKPAKLCDCAIVPHFQFLFRFSLPA